MKSDGGRKPPLGIMPAPNLEQPFELPRGQGFQFWIFLQELAQIRGKILRCSSFQPNQKQSNISEGHVSETNLHPGIEPAEFYHFSELALQFVGVFTERFLPSQKREGRIAVRPRVSFV